MAEQEVYVDTRYPIPANVDGIIYYVAEEAREPKTWQASLPENRSEDVPTPLVATPVPREVVEQKVSYALGGTASASGVLIIDEVPYVSDYEIRIVPA